MGTGTVAGMGPHLVVKYGERVRLSEAEVLSPRIWRPKPDMVHEEQTFLEAETAYLDALDAQSGHLESEWLSRYMKDGEIGARRWKKNVYKNMTTNEETQTAKHN
jgi:hypothetical protein